jgi:hypothetical protein
MSQVIDVSGLPEAVVSDPKRLVEPLRGQPRPATELPPNEMPEEWVARLVAWAESHPKSDVIADDSRESIYEGRGE